MYFSSSSLNSSFLIDGKNGKFNGFCKTFYENGTVESYGFRKNDIPVKGTFHKFNIDGSEIIDVDAGEYVDFDEIDGHTPEEVIERIICGIHILDVALREIAGAGRNLDRRAGHLGRRLLDNGNGFAKPLHDRLRRG